MSTVAAAALTAFCFGFGFVVVGFAVGLQAVANGWRPLEARREHRERMAQIKAAGPGEYARLLKATDATLERLAERVEVPVEVFYGSYDEQYRQLAVRGGSVPARR